MSFTGAIEGSRYSATRPRARVAIAQEEERRGALSERIGTGTLACARCDAPIAIQDRRLAPSDELACPYCAHQGRVHEFLSLAAPARATKVVIRLARGR